MEPTHSDKGVPLTVMVEKQSQLSVWARYRGRQRKRADYVRDSAAAMSQLPGVISADVVGIEEISISTESAESTAQVVLAFVSAGEWAIGIGIGGKDPRVVARSATGKKGGWVNASIATLPTRSELSPKELASDIEAAFALIGHVLARRTAEGREATALMRQGLTQIDAAEQLGISKQAMSQRLYAAGWHAEQVGWDLIVHLLERAESLD